MSEPIYKLYPELKTYREDYLTLDNSHEIYYEECGNSHGIPVIFLHGGPGSGCNPAQRRFFDPSHYRIILLDQRGCGRSLPLGEVRFNTTADLVADIEKLRKHLGINRWHVFGGSWGSTLALSYATVHRDQVISLTLRGIFLSRASELNWFLGDVRHFFPEVWNNLVNYLPTDNQHDILNAYAALIFNEDMRISAPAAVQWNAFESAIMRLKPQASESAQDNATKSAKQLQDEQAAEIARARVQIHYIQNRCFIDGDALLQSAANLANIPTVIVQGRYDMVCPPQTAWALYQMMPHAKFVMVADAGHSAMEPGITSALVEAAEAFKILA